MEPTEEIPHNDLERARNKRDEIRLAARGLDCRAIRADIGCTQRGRLAVVMYFRPPTGVLNG